MKFVSLTILSSLAIFAAASPLDATVQKRDRTAGAPILEARTGTGRPHGNATEKFCDSKGLEFNPSSGYCFNPKRHPSEINCATLGQLYNKKTNKCYSAHAKPSKANCEKIGLDYNKDKKKCVKPKHPKKCPNGKHPILGQPKKCGSCGWCQPYHSVGQPVCTKSGKCTLICPKNKHVQRSHGLVWCE